MIICNVCGVEYDIIKLSLEEETLYRVMKQDSLVKSYHCNRECYDKVANYSLRVSIHSPYVDKDGWIKVNHHRKQYRQLQRRKRRQHNYYNKLSDINTVNESLNNVVVLDE
jgi:hypothetical protein